MVVTPPTRQSVALSDPELRRALTRLVRARAPEADVEDVVQSTLVEAIAAENAPQDPEELRKWVFGIARHKIVDRHRKAGRVELTGDELEVAATSAPHSAEDLLRWVESALPENPEAKKTLEWMAREAEGDKLEAIAAEERIPAARVRQRVSRLRRLLRERWAAAAALGVLVLTAIGYWSSRGPKGPAPVASVTPSATPFERARAMRDAALERCGAGAWEACVKGLDDARALDPVGDEASAVQEARAAAARRGAPEPPPSAEPAPSPSAVPSARVVAPAPKPTASAVPRAIPSAPPKRKGSASSSVSDSWGQK
jgi:RNA polymerase sigma factor (sigma-70 family)